MKHGRNDACPCGSGKKFKRCCGQEVGVPTTSSTPPAALNQYDVLIAQVNAGHLIEAEGRVSVLLESRPADGMLWKILSVVLVKQGKEALPALSKTIALLPQDAEAHGNLGATLLGLGRIQEAVIPYRRALQLNPGLLEAHNNLGNALFALGQFQEAADCYRSALRIKADDPSLHVNLANALRLEGNLPEAISSARKAISLNPDLSAAYNILGLALVAQGHFEQALSYYQRALALDQTYVDALNNLGNALRDLGNRREALAAYGRAVELDSSNAESHCNLGNVLFEFRQIDQAEVSYRRALALRPDYRPAHLALSMALRMQGRAADAEASCRAALALDADYVEALSLLGELLADRGQFTEAQKLFQRAIDVNPAFPFVYFSIAMHRKMTSDDAQWLESTQALLTTRLPQRHEISLRYALGKFFDDVKQYEPAFENYRQANELTKRGGLRYDAEKLHEHVDHIIESFDATAIRAKQVYGDSSERPIFIVGMPRSGTTLTEQILASHPAVFGAGELTYWDGSYGAYEAGQRNGAADAAVIPNIARAYLERLSQLSGAALRVIDKMPPNFMNLGLIHAAFPNARIVHMQRHPLDTCLSIYFQYFLNAHPYANDLHSLAHYYAEYLRIMEHWRRSIPATALLEVPYEGLIAEQEGWSRRMVEFVGLPWDPRCLDFHQTDRVVITTSKWQVRQKIHSASAGRWKSYEKFVGPLKGLMNPRGAAASSDAATPNAQP
jgi:tetratricopeptide (TPR) repeat protein